MEQPSPDHRRPTALVLGATGRIGSAVARELATAGMAVAVQCRSNRIGAEQLVDTLPGGPHRLVQTDLFEPDRVAALFDEVGVPDVLVNAVHCQFDPRRVEESTWERDWLPHLASMRVHYEACRHAVTGMRERQFGRIVLISGSLAARPMPGCAAYASIKGGLHAFQRVLAAEVGQYGITVNAVAPCRVQPDDGREATENPESWERLNAAVESASALPRDPTATEVASAVGYLAGPGAGGMTGQVMYLARGQVMPG